MALRVVADTNVYVSTFQFGGRMSKIFDLAVARQRPTLHFGTHPRRDRDLLVLNAFGNISIMSPGRFLDSAPAGLKSRAG